MKRSIVISLMASMTVGAFGCGMPGTHNYYLFSTVGQGDYSLRISQQTMQNWRAYSGKDIYWYDAEELRKAARRKGDALMVSYIDELEKYLAVAGDVRNDWEYPSKEEQARRQEVLRGVQEQALSNVDSRLRSQYALLYMRSTMMLGQHEQNVKFWEQTASGFINSVYRDMMRNIYAGALLKTGRTEEATRIFVEQGDVESLYTYFYKSRSLDDIRQEYERDPKSPALLFLVQDFVNNAQETVDAQQEGNWPGKLYVRDIKKAEAEQMCEFARQVVSEQKTDNPALWKAAEAWLQYLFGHKLEALAAIREASGMPGSLRARNNARVLRLYIEAAVCNVNHRMDNYLAPHLAWLEQKADEERRMMGSNDYDNHYTQAYDRLIHQQLVPRYEKAGRLNEALAFLSVYNERSVAFYMKQYKRKKRYSGWNEDYSTDFFAYIDTVAVEHAENYLAFMQKRQPASVLEYWLLRRIYRNNEFMHELIGTKYMRLGQWTEAEEHLKQVSVRYINTMNIVPFMAARSYKVEPWMKRQPMSLLSQEPGRVRIWRNPKLDFVREMRQLEANAQLSPQQAYDLAVRYAQASYAGDAWYLTRYGKSCEEEPRPNDTVLLTRADELLQLASNTAVPELKEKFLFARAWLPLEHWATVEWDEKKGDYVRKVHTDARQYKALKQLANFEQYNGQRADYVSRCDVLKQFLEEQ